VPIVAHVGIARLPMSLIINTRGNIMPKYITAKDGDVMREIALRHMNQGDLVKRKPDAKAVYVINHRNRATKDRAAEYSLSDWHDMNREIFLKEDTVVYTDFTF